MAALTSHLFTQDTLTVDDENMEISSDVGRPNTTDDDIDIDIDFGENQTFPHIDDSMIDDIEDTHDAYHELDNIQDDEMVDESGAEDGITQDGIEGLDEVYEEDEELDDVEVDVGPDHEPQTAESQPSKQNTPESFHEVVEPQEAASGETADQFLATVSDLPSEQTGFPLEEGEDVLQDQSQVGHGEQQLDVHAAEEFADHAAGGSEAYEGLREEQESEEPETHTLAPQQSINSGSEENDHDVGDGTAVPAARVRSNETQDDGAAAYEQVPSNLQASHVTADLAGSAVSEVLANVASHEASAALDSRQHPVICVFNGQAMHLFPGDQKADVTPEHLLGDRSLTSANLQDFLASCRVALGTDITDNEELVIGMTELGLSLSEDSNQASLFSLADVVDIYVQLCQNDDISDPDPIYLSLTTKHRFASRMTDLSSAVRDGLGWSSLVSQEDETEGEHVPDEDNPDGLEESSLTNADEIDSANVSELSGKAVTGPSFQAANAPHPINTEELNDVNVNRQGGSANEAHLQHVETIVDDGQNAEVEDIDDTGDGLEDGIEHENAEVHEQSKSAEEAQENFLDYNAGAGEEHEEEDPAEEADAPTEAQREAGEVESTSDSATVQGDQPVVGAIRDEDADESYEEYSNQAADTEAAAEQYDESDQIELPLDDDVEEQADHETMLEPFDVIDAGQPRDAAHSASITDPTNRKRSRGTADEEDEEDSDSGSKKVRAS